MGIRYMLYQTLPNTNLSVFLACSYVGLIICLFLTEIFGHIRRTLFDNDGVPYADMRALANEEFKAVGELMACSLVQGGPASSFLSMIVYDYLVHGMSSIQSEKWTSLVTDNSLRQSMEGVILTCSTCFHCILKIAFYH